MNKNDNEYFPVYANYSLAEHATMHVEFLKEISTSGDKLNDIIRIISLPPWDERPGRIEINNQNTQINEERHTVFFNILKQISEGKSFENIKRFRTIFFGAENIERKDVFELRGKEIINRPRLNFLHTPSESALSIHAFLFCLACYSLLNFLSCNKREKIKCCPYCKKIFIAKDTKRKICYEKACFTQYMREQKQRQREVDPVKYL